MRPRHCVESEMFVREYGAPTGGAAVLWVHGLGESGLCFEGVVGRAPLAARRHLVPDLPGYGRSAWPAQPPELAAVAGHLASWLKARGEAPVIVVGHSMGGVVATLMAEGYPEVVARVVDVDGNLSAGDCTYSGVAAAQTAAALVAGGFDRLRAEVWAAGAADPASRGYYASLRLADPATFHRHSCELVALSASETLAVRLAALACPAAYVAGAPGGACQRSRELLASAGVATRVIEPAGHWPFLDRPDAFAAVLGGLIDSDEAAPPPPS